MRWWMWLIIVVLAAAVCISLIRQPGPKVGEQLLTHLETQGSSLRAALPIFDYDGTEDPLQKLNIERGTGTPPGSLSMPAGAGERYWMRWKSTESDVPSGEFTWGKVDPEENTLRVGMHAARDAVARAFSKMGYFREGVDGWIQSALNELDRQDDEDLFLAWMRADRAVLSDTTETPRAIREVLLLLARDSDGPVLAIAGGKGKVTYLLPDSTTRRSDTWVLLEHYVDGKLAWAGTLHLMGRPLPEKVQGIAARVAREAAAVQPKTPTEN